MYKNILSERNYARKKNLLKPHHKLARILYMLPDKTNSPKVLRPKVRITFLCRLLWKEL